MSHRIGIDLGGTKISACVVNNEYQILSKVSCPTRAERSPDEITADIAALCVRATEEAGIEKSDVASVGIGTPGAVEGRSGTVVYSCNLPFSFYPLADKLREMTGFPRVYVENDANAAALGEAVAGAAKGTFCSVMITLGTGVGGGIIQNGKILTGYNGAAGELGHTVIVHNGVLCPCGRRGCFEAYSSASALVRMTKERLSALKAKSIPSLMLDACSGEPENADTRTVFDAAKKEDAEAKRLLAEYIDYLACGIVNLVNTFQPEVLLIGGGLSGEKEFLLDPLIPIVDREQYTRDYRKKTVLRIAALGNNAGLIGAAALED